jgi:uncharacterized protein
MSFAVPISRRQFLHSTSALAAGLMASRATFPKSVTGAEAPLEEFSYADVALASDIHNQQLDHTHAVLMELSEDSLLKPFRRMVGQPAPGEELGGWYLYDPDYDWHTFDAGFAPAATFGQWVSALARTYAIKKDERIRDKILRLNQLYAKTIAGDFYENNRFPAYCYDKLVCGLMDSHHFAGDPDAYRILEHTTDTALPHLPKKAIEHGDAWRPGKDESYTWDESYTMPENLFLAYRRGAGDRYRALGLQYLDDQYFDPLSRGESSFAGRHAYSHINALSSAMQAYLTVGSEKHLRAAKNAFDILQTQSFVTGGWGPDELLRADKSDEVYASLTNTHNSFETPCGAYAHFKLTRYLLRVTRDSRYGDSMERMMYNTVLGAKPLESDGRTFYYSDYNFKGRKIYCDHRWPCCSGTLPQVAADYRINTYFHDAQGVYVNLYIPSTVSWKHQGKDVSLTQKSAYPFDSALQFEVSAPGRQEFDVHLRIPAWAERTLISVNGKREKDPVVPGRFAALRRRWKTGDRIEVDLPLARRLEAVNAQHPKTVALLQGPLVLFAITGEAPRITRGQLLAAKKVGPERWSVETSAGSLDLLPFTAIGDEQYSTYLNVED